MIGKTFSYDRKNSLIRQFFDAYRKVLRRSIVLIISCCFGRFSGLFLSGVWRSPTFLLWVCWKWWGEGSGVAVGVSCGLWFDVGKI